MFSKKKTSIMLFQLNNLIAIRFKSLISNTNFESQTQFIVEMHQKLVQRSLKGHSVNSCDVDYFKIL